MAISLDTILTSIDTISGKFNNNVLVTEARDAIKKGLDLSELSQEEIDRIYSNFSQQLALGLLGQAVALAENMPKLIAENSMLTKEDDNLEAKLQRELDILDEQKKKLIAENSMLKKQDDKLDAKLDAELGILAKQKDGFYKDAVYKGMKVASEQTSMLAQAEMPPPDWMPAYIKSGADILKAR